MRNFVAQNKRDRMLNLLTLFNEKNYPKNLHISKLICNFAVSIRKIITN